MQVCYITKSNYTLCYNVFLSRKSNALGLTVKTENVVERHTLNSACLLCISGNLFSGSLLFKLLLQLLDLLSLRLMFLLRFPHALDVFQSLRMPTLFQVLVLFVEIIQMCVLKTDVELITFIY